jgi:predicted flap endonuclease-1-like 5' DNA nuclease
MLHRNIVEFPMALTAEFPDLEAARDTARKALAVRIGFASPFWLAFGAAASAGVAFWWATRWAAPVNVEALAFEEALAELPEPEDEPAPRFVAAEVPVETAVEAPVADEIKTEPFAWLESDEAPAVEPLGDDLTRLSGIGPKLASALADRGITTFAQLAAWTEEHAAAFDAELSLKGRVARDAWVEQAKRLAEEG